MHRDTGKGRVGAQLTRRRFFAGMGTALAGVALASQLPGRLMAAPKIPSGLFTLGVASGDPWPDGFVLWTRLAPEPLNGGGMPPRSVAVQWRPANPIVLTGDVHANWVADLKANFADPNSATLGTEFIGTSISSGGDGVEVSASAAIVLTACGWEIFAFTMMWMRTASPSSSCVLSAKGHIQRHR